MDLATSTVIFQSQNPGSLSILKAVVVNGRELKNDERAERLSNWNFFLQSGPISIPKHRASSLHCRRSCQRMKGELSTRARTVNFI